MPITRATRPASPAATNPVPVPMSATVMVVVELGGGGETLDDGLVVVDEAHLVPVRGDAVEEGRDALGRELAHDATALARAGA